MNCVFKEKEKKMGALRFGHDHHHHYCKLQRRRGTSCWSQTKLCVHKKEKKKLNSRT